jgi:hypothetical protein
VSRWASAGLLLGVHSHVLGRIDEFLPPYARDNGGSAVRMNEDSLAIAPLAASPKEDKDVLEPLDSTSLAVEGVRETGTRSGKYEVVE